MADKNIGSLPKAANLDRDSRLVMDRQGEAMSLDLGQLQDFCKEGVDPIIADAKTASEEAMIASDEAKEAVQRVDSYTNAAQNARNDAEEAAQRAETALSRMGTAAEDAERSAQAAAQSERNVRNAEENVVEAEGRLAAYTESALESKGRAEAAAATATSIADSLDIEAIYSAIAMKGDNLEFDDAEEKLYLTSNGVRISDGITIVTSGGSSSGSSNNAVMSLTNTSGWIYKTVSSGAACPVSINWSSLENELATGPGVLRITVNNTVKHQAAVDQGDIPLEIGSYLSTGSNVVRITVSDVYGNSRTIALNVTAVALSLASEFDASVPRTGAFDFTYTPTGAAVKTVYFVLDGEEHGTATVSTSGRQQTYNIPAQEHGSHTLEVYFTSVVDGETVPSNRLYYDIICLEEGNNTPVITSDFNMSEVEQFDSIVIPYRVYDPANMTAAVTLAADGVEVKTLTVDRTLQTWTYRVDASGAMELTISCGTAEPKVFSLEITESKIDVEAETNNLSIYLSSYGRSNNEENPGVWESGDVAAEFSGFNFTSDGWQQDNDGITVLRVTGDARLNIPLSVFKQDFRGTGKTIEIEFASREVLDYDAVLATCWSGNRGIEITAQKTMFKSEQSEVTSRYKEDDHLRISFVIEKRSSRRLIISYVNGIISGMMQYPDDDDFSQANPVGISIGSNDCTIDLYNIRVYDNDLTRFQVLDNWIADTQIGAEKKDRYERNNIFDDYGQILPSTLRPHQCYMVLDCPVLPTFKGDIKICSGYYVDPVNTARSFSFEGAEIDAQGTSSQFYYVKNFKIKFNGGFKMENGTVAESYAMNNNAVPTAEFTFKADVASSEGANNVVLAELYNDLCPVKTPAQEADPKVRQTIQGHPIVMFHDDGTGAKFIGKYNFNNDKGTPEVFGFAEGDESWEIRENGNAQVSFKTDDFTGWETSFEARYPDKNKDITRLQQFVSWVASTDTTATGLSAAQKTARLNKFKTELSQWADVDDAIFYYLFTLIFLCIDQREKNAFPTYNAEMAKWLWLFYDADSSLGTDNKGNLTFEYWMEDIDFTAAGDPVFNGQSNVFWSNLRECFADEIRDEYRRLRTEIGADGKVLLSYDKVDGLFHEHQSQWSEAIFNEDAWRKAIEPLEKINDDQYLPMQQGKKEQHFKHWMYNRFRYLDSKFETGAALDEENRIMMRAHAQGNIWLTSYINMYGQVYFNSARDEHRMTRDQAYEFEWKAMGAEDAVIGVNSAPMITSLGDLSPLMLEYCYIQHASHLTELKVGDAGDEEHPYVNDNFVALTLGNNKLLRKLDVRNCTALAQSVDASGCTNIEEVYFDGTAITGCKLPNGGILKKLHLPETITNLTIQNQTKMTEFVLPGYSNITTLRLENVSDVVPVREIFNAIPLTDADGNQIRPRVRLIGFNWSFDSAEDILSFYDRLDTMRGLDENGGNMDKAQMSGTVWVNSLTGAQLAEMQSRYPSIAVGYAHITSNLYFYDDTGSTLLYTAAVADGGDGVYGGSTPSKEADAQYIYSFAGWSLTPGGSVDGNALKAVTADRNVYAAYSTTVRTYTVTWMNGSTVLETDSNVPYGTVPVYNGADPVYSGADADDYKWIGWSPAVAAITGDTTYTAVFKYSGYIYTKLIDHTISGEYENDRVDKVGNYAFFSCSALTAVDFPVATSIGVSAFERCTSLTSVNFPAATAVGHSAFKTCSGLTAGNFPAVTSVDNYGFSDCLSLETLDFPALERIGYYGLGGCAALTTLILRNEEKVCVLGSSNALDKTPIASGTGYIYVPAALVSSYKSAWSTYANQIRAIEDYPDIVGG